MGVMIIFSWIKALENLIIKKDIVDQSNLNITKQNERRFFKYSTWSPCKNKLKKR